jgi:hypothetical protein
VHEPTPLNDKNLTAGSFPAKNDHGNESKQLAHNRQYALPDSGPEVAHMCRYGRVVGGSRVLPSAWPGERCVRVDQIGGSGSVASTIGTA